MRSWTWMFGAAVALGVVAGCGGTNGSGINSSYSNTPSFGAEDATKSANASEKQKMTSESELKASASVNASGFALAQTLKIGESKKNELISPLSTDELFALVANGLDGKTLEAVQKLLALGDTTLDTLNTGHKSALARIKALDGQPLQVANAIWYREPVKLPQAFSDLAKTSYEAQAASLPDDSTAALRKVNDWVAGATKNRIKKLFSELKQDEKVVLVNALAFDGLWKTPFDTKLTKKLTFHAPSGDRDVDMMKQSGSGLGYGETDEAQIARLDYKDRDFSMVIVLPKDGVALSKLVAGLTDTTWTTMLAGVHSLQGEVTVPKFKFEASYDLVPTLKAMGAEALFTASDDFKKMLGETGSQAAIAQVVHKTYIEVDEKGTKAAAATGATVALTSMPATSPFKFVADHPFAFAIVDNHSNALVFFGVLNEP